MGVGRVWRKRRSSSGSAEEMYIGRSCLGRGWGREHSIFSPREVLGKRYSSIFDGMAI